LKRKDERKMLRKKSKLLSIACLIAVTVVLHYIAPKHPMYLHILLQALFFIPVSLSGLWFGKKGGLGAATAISATYLYHAVTVMMPSGEMAVSNGIQILLMFVVGALIGTYTDIKRSYLDAIRGGGSEPGEMSPHGQSLLVYVDESRASTNAVRYVANLCQRIPDLKVTLLGAVRKPNPELFASEDELGKEEAKAIAVSESAVETARSLILQGGIGEDRIFVRNATFENARPSDLILSEQKSGDYNAIVVGKHRLSRAEEFLFGNVAINVARRAACPVWVIGEKSVTALDKTRAENGPDRNVTEPQTTGKNGESGN
jgi:nucleotide-binding universal stress UspA family protein